MTPHVLLCSSTKASVDAVSNKPSTSSSNASGKNKNIKKVPVVPYGVDLFDWGQDFEVPMIARYHTFTFPSD